MMMTYRMGNHRESMRGGRWKWLAAAGLAALMTPGVAVAQQNETVSVQIAAQPLDVALLALSRQANVDIVAPTSLTANRSAPSVEGVMDAEQALRRLLHGSGLTFNRTGVRSYAVVPFAPLSPTAGADPESDGTPILVTGSRIRGATRTSPVTTVTQEDMRNAGQNDLGEVVRSLPQNFAGGQNPGLTISAGGAANQNQSSASAINLRGLGPDATLTLLNGHRLPYETGRQGIDVSAFPVAAIDRIEIMTDGASALYGSDAVGGVANIILRRDYSGLDARARIGVSTDGGNEQQQYSAVGGHIWSDGGVMLTFDYSRNTQITARQRPFTSDVPDDSTLLPSQRHYGLVLSAHHAITDRLSIETDAFFSDRKSVTNTPYSPAGYQVAGDTARPSLRSWGATPRVLLDIGGDWEVTASASYGESTTDRLAEAWSNGAIASSTPSRWQNTVLVAEISGEGPLIQLPAGPVRLAIGSGYRQNGLNTELVSYSFDETRDSYYGFAEASVPLFSPQNSIPGIHRLVANVALRFEDYPELRSVTTPRVGFVYEPIPDIALKGAWGRSFKAPTLTEQYSFNATILMPVAAAGGQGYPAGSTILYRQGSNPQLVPERARTWSATIALQPRAIPDARLEVSYFDIDYTNRVVAPIASLGEALSSSLYAPFITSNPNVSEQDAAISPSSVGLRNVTGSAYDPGAVVAIVDNRFTNVARQRARGLDFSGQYRARLGQAESLTLSGNATYMTSRRQLLEGAEEIPLAGRIFNPPNWRLRGGVTWTDEQTTVAAFANYLGPVDDPRFGELELVSSMTTIDLTVRHVIRSRGLLDGLEVTVSAANLLNEEPKPIRVTASYFPPYDSTNHSAVGRFISLSVGKAF